MDDKQRCLPISACALHHHILQLTSPQLATCTVQAHSGQAIMHGWCTLLHVGTVVAVVVTRV